MTTPAPTVHTLNVADLAGGDMSERDVRELRSLLRHLASCSIGQSLLRVAVERRLVIRLVDLDELDWGARGMVGGYYSSSANLIAIAKRAGRDQQLSTLAHELQHFVDHSYGWSLGTVQCEVRANQTEALAIQQLALHASCYALTNTRARVHPEAIAETIRGTNLYRYNTEEPPRADGRVHPLVEASVLMPPAVLYAAGLGGGAGPIGAVSVAPMPPAALMRTVGGVGAAAASSAAGPAFAMAAPAGASAVTTAWIAEPVGACGAADRYNAAVRNAAW
jgi:hypothetical protein